MNVSDEIARILAGSENPKAELQALRETLRRHLAKGFPTGSWWANDVLIEGAIEQLGRRKKPRKAKSECQKKHKQQP
jgi:hypothetical protein